MINVQLTAEQHAFLIALLSERAHHHNESAAEAEDCGAVEEAAEYRSEALICSELVSVIRAASGDK